MPASIVVAEPRPVLRAGLRAWLSAGGMEIVGEASTAAEALDLVERHFPSVLLTEIDLGGHDGLACLTAVVRGSHATCVLFLTDNELTAYAARAFALGAAGYLPKSIQQGELVDAVRRAAAGESCWSEDQVRRLTSAAPDEAPPVGGVALTQRERQVLKQLTMGLTNREIAQLLGISYDTVKEHVQHILRKVGVTDRTQAAVWAVRHGLA